MTRVNRDTYTRGLRSRLRPDVPSARDVRWDLPAPSSRIRRWMRSLSLIAISLVVAGAASSVSAQPTKVRGPFLLVSLPSLGTVSWRCSLTTRPGVAPGQPAMALGFRAFVRSATTVVRLRADGATVSRHVVQPGESVRLAFAPKRVQHLDIVQGTGAGTLRAFVKVDFARGGCYSYQPPRVDVRVLPRR